MRQPAPIWWSCSTPMLPAARTEAWALGISQSVGARRTLRSRCQGCQCVPGCRGCQGASRVAVAGIAHPQQFFEMLREAGTASRGRSRLPIITATAPVDIARIADAVRSAGAAADLARRRRMWCVSSAAPRCRFSVECRRRCDSRSTAGTCWRRAIEAALAAGAGGGVRHRLEYMAVVAIRARASACCRTAWSAAAARVLGLTFYAVDRGSSPRRAGQPRAVLSVAHRCPSAAQIARAMFAHFGRLLFEMLKFSTLSHAEMLERVEFEGEDRARLAYARAKACCSSPATSASGSCTRSCTACSSSRSACWRARSTIRRSTRCSKTCDRAPATA